MSSRPLGPRRRGQFQTSLATRRRPATGRFQDFAGAARGPQNRLASPNQGCSAVAPGRMLDMRLPGTRAGRALCALAVSLFAALGVAIGVAVGSSPAAGAGRATAAEAGTAFTPTAEPVPAPAPEPAPAPAPPAPKKKKPRPAHRSPDRGRRSCAEQPGTVTCRVLFIGNSYTFVNHLPLMFKRLAGSGHHRVRTGLLASPGESLAQHVASPDTFRTIGAFPWNIVVLQERGEYPAVAQYRESETYPAARDLVRKVRATGARPLFFLTWAQQHGWPRYGLDYASMQADVDTAYEALGHQLDTAIAPVGPAWWATLQRLHEPRLWIADGTHPTVQGSYLAACVFYAVIYRESPEGLTYRAGLPRARARKLQQIATAVVLGEPGRWGRP